MRVIVFDGETTVQFIKEHDPDTGKTRVITDGSPYANNRLVTAHWALYDFDADTNSFKFLSRGYSVFHHKQYPNADRPDDLQAALDQADIFVAHNAKFDYAWLRECGFRLPPKVWCTMIGEYILARGTIVRLSLKETAIRRKVRLKKDDLTHDLFNQGIGYEEMDLDVVLEYGDADVDSASDIFIQQWLEFHDGKTRLINIVDLMNDMLIFLVEIEKNGLKIDLKALNDVKLEYEAERKQLIIDLNRIVVDVMGDTPINLNSGADVSMVVYSRKVIDRKLHQQTFNIGMDEFGRDQYPPRMSPTQFANSVRTTTKRVDRTVAVNCPTCQGNKFVRKFKKDGTPFKNTNKCNHCEGRGFLFNSTGQIAGLKLVPESARDASINGFKCGHDELNRLIDQAKRRDNLQAVEFLTKKKRLNAINTYLNSFVGGIERWTRPNSSILHATFNQCVARTGRLSSSDPNFQNQPKGRKFPIRRVVISRWANEGGLICEADFSGLEFVVAGELSQDSQIIHDVLNDKDVHGQTASIVTQQPDPTIDWKDKLHKPIRDENKPYTFAPLYGGQGANEPEHIRLYFKEFFNIYKGHEEWQFKMMDDVIRQGFIETPSGRQYMFPGTRRLKGRRTSNATNIVNYPVQGFATGDIVPLACIRSLRRFRELGLSSVLILTVHDSIVVDVYPGELERVREALRWAMTEIDEEILERWNYKMVLPLRMEISAGPNWGELETLH